MPQQSSRPCSCDYCGRYEKQLQLNLKNEIADALMIDRDALLSVEVWEDEGGPVRPPIPMYDDI